jgi:cytochrome P450
MLRTHLAQNDSKEEPREQTPEVKPNSSSFIFNCLSRPIQRVGKYLGNTLPSYLTNHTAHLPGITITRLFQRGGLGQVMDDAEAAASQHPNQISLFHIGPYQAAYVRQHEHISDIYHQTNPSAHPIPKNGDKSGIYPYLFGHTILNMLNTDPAYKTERIFYYSALMDKNRLAHSAHVMYAAIQTHLKKHPPEQMTNVQELRTFVNRIIMTMVAETQLGLVDLSDAEKDRLAELVQMILPELSNLKLIAHLKLEEKTGWRPQMPLDKTLKEGYAYLQTLINRNRDNILKAPEDPKQELFLRQYLRRVAADKKIDLNTALEEECRRFVALVLFAGYESTSTSTFFTAMLLADPNHANIAEKLRQDIMQHWDGIEPLTKAHIDKMTYLDQVTKEAQRLYPPFPTFKDVLNEDIMLGDVLLKKGTILFISPFRTHRIHSANNVDNPDTFMPRTGLQPKDPRYQFFTFGPEPTRTCPGMDVATLENKIVMAHLISQYDLRLANLQHPFGVEEVYSLHLACTIDPQDEGIKFTPIKRNAMLLDNNEEKKHQNTAGASKENEITATTQHEQATASLLM